MAAAWRPLPAGLSEPARWLVQELRDLKDRSGLSLARLESRTNYSKSSWERWLNGRQLPPRDAVVRLAELSGGDTRLLVQLRERAAGAAARESTQDQHAQDRHAPPEPAGQPAPEGTPDDAGAAPRQLRRNRAAALAAVLLVAGVATAVSLRAGGPAGGEGPAPGAAPRAPVATTVRLAGELPASCPQFLISRPASQVPPPPEPTRIRAWATWLGGVDAGLSTARVTVQGLAGQAVVLQGLSVTVASRGPGIPAATYLPEDGCGAALPERVFAVDLDARTPVPRPQPSGTGAGPITFPFRVSAAEPEVFVITASTRRCDCRWYLELHWASGGRSGRLRIDDHGRPFRTAAGTGLPGYVYRADQKRWAENG
jgi:transcriptional regulator with XRE-family HTH domain